METGIHIEGRPEWTFVKIHTHGAEDCDMDTLLGPAMDEAYRYLESRYNDGSEWKLHYVSAREMYNIAKAAEAGDGEAMFLLSQSYAYGLGTRPALDAAQTWMVKAAEAGYPDAAQVLKLNNAGTEG